MPPVLTITTPKASGRELSGLRITVKPFGRVYWVIFSVPEVTSKADTGWETPRIRITPASNDTKKCLVFIILCVGLSECKVKI